MDFYIARQPIFTVHKKLYGYELLYRGFEGAGLPQVSGIQATANMLSSVFFTDDIGAIAGAKPCFIKFNEELLQRKIAFSLPKNRVVIEVVEEVPPTGEILVALRELKNAGYTIALDDFVYDRKKEPFVDMASIIKIDVRLTPLDSVLKIIHHLERFRIKLLAEKVETIKDYERAVKLGFHYIEGYFFSKPEKYLIKEIAANQATFLTLLAEVAKKTTTLERLNKIISNDLAISYKLLRFLNSAYFYRIQKVTSVKNAIAFLGEKELRRFLLLVIVSKLAEEKSSELIRHSLLRAKFCELLAKNSSFAEYELDLYMLGMFSLIDTIMESDMAVIMERLPISDMVRDALVLHQGAFAPFLEAMITYERRQSARFAQILQTLSIDVQIVPELYLEALKYSNGML